ncbi:hypothetical protein [Methylobacterium gnaphalii]|uniref:Uncharacterized protein n=1 Tax=Methylobacterium gnaphalii TaxID=1010610 RepID=A0A512JMR0_9HYPH|nr:hypothetical protein [Methylobacterium gnaphalii]GEP11261.1 hypothetical protein MGN01_31060 [Methylobacterium gnaphalii]GJD71451.1 hypothetical protein MMMDOFMJ_4410 [Methylobacterium gnaphalii]GLS49961.1 hypothetical protein GCM10007885_28130 [Methylobacterium gnaphalii]
MKARRSAQFTRSEIVRVLKAYEEAGLPPPRVVMRRDGVIFEPATRKAPAAKPEHDDALAEEREPWIM